jgi:hypothetical protein
MSLPPMRNFERRSIELILQVKHLSAAQSFTIKHRLARAEH